MRDPYAGHRPDDETWWVPDQIADTQWTMWDYALMEAHSAIESFTSAESGQLRWLADDPDVYWGVGIHIDHAAADLKNAYDEGGDLPNGANLYLKNPQKVGDAPFWTLEQWLENLSDEDGDYRFVRGAQEGAHPPDADEYAAMMAAREERLARFRDDS